MIIQQQLFARALENLQNSQEKTNVEFSFQIKLQAFNAVILLKRRLRHKCFPVNFANFLRTAYLCKTPPVVASYYILLFMMNLQSIYCIS